MLTHTTWDSKQRKQTVCCFPTHEKGNARILRLSCLNAVLCRAHVKCRVYVVREECCHCCVSTLFRSLVSLVNSLVDCQLSVPVLTAVTSVLSQFQVYKTYSSVDDIPWYVTVNSTIPVGIGRLFPCGLDQLIVYQLIVTSDVLYVVLLTC